MIDWVTMGRYKNLRPSEVAQKGLANLINKIPQMIQDYTNAMERFRNDQDAQARYLSGVTVWTEVMRSGDVRAQIANAISQARAQYYNRRIGLISVGSTVPATVTPTMR
jgi:hypothetical protein